MLVVRNLQVESFDMEHLDIDWEIEDTDEDVNGYSFHVLRSVAPTGPFVDISGALVDQYTFRDVDVNLLNRWREFYYQIQVIRNSDALTETYGSRTVSERDEGAGPGAVSNEAPPPVLLQEISRRMEFVLLKEFTGRRCWVFPVRSFGQRCSECWDVIKQRRHKSHCLTCIPTGDPITLADGTETPVEEVEVGDSVLTHEGRGRRVLEVMARDTDEPIHVVRTIYGKELRATSEHPVLGVREKDYYCAHVSHRRVNDGSCRSCPPLEEQLCWIPISEIRVGDRVMAPRPVEEGSTTWTEARVRLLGLYVAEGCVSARKRVSGESILRLTRFGFHAREQVLVDSVSSISEKIYGIAPKVYAQGANCRTVNLSCREAAEWLALHGGRYSAEKRLSEQAFNLPAPLALTLFAAYSDGDGCYSCTGRSRMLITTTASPQLANQWQLMLWRLGIGAVLRKCWHEDSRPGKKSGPIYKIEINGSEIEPLLPHKLISVPYEPASATRRYAMFSRTGRLLRVVAVGVESYRGTVHNLEVEEDHSYVVGGVAVHNCFDTSYVGGFHTPILSYVNFNPSNRDLQLHSLTAMERSGTVAMMGRHPRLKPADLIVDPENRRWRVQSVGSTEQLRAFAHQVLQLTEIPRSDVEYKVPIVTPTDYRASSYRQHRAYQNIDDWKADVGTDVSN